jgi:hypothetical protein
VQQRQAAEKSRAQALSAMQAARPKPPTGGHTPKPVTNYPPPRLPSNNPSKTLFTFGYGPSYGPQQRTDAYPPPGIIDRSVYNENPKYKACVDEVAKGYRAMLERGIRQTQTLQGLKGPCDEDCQKGVANDIDACHDRIPDDPEPDLVLCTCPEQHRNSPGARKDKDGKIWHPYGIHCKHNFLPPTEAPPTGRSGGTPSR